MTNPCPTDFCNSVPNVLINRFDPVTGLEDFVHDIKPFHTKVVEVLVEYVHCDELNVTIEDEWAWVITLVCPSPAMYCPPERCTGGFGEQPWDGLNSIEPLLDVKRILHGPPPVPDQNDPSLNEYVADGFVVAGDVTEYFTNREVFEFKFSRVPEYNGFYTVYNDSVYDSVEDETVIRTLQPVYDYHFMDPPDTTPIGKIKVPTNEIDELTYQQAVAPPFPAVGETWWQVADMADPQQDENIIYRWDGIDWRPAKCYFIGYDSRDCEFTEHDWRLDVHFGETFTITQIPDCARIVDVDQPGSCITVERDWTNILAPEVLGEPIENNMAFFITQSTGNNGMYTIESLTYNPGDNTTTICTKNPIPDATVDGFLGCVATIHLRDLLEVWDMENYRRNGYEHPYEHNAKPLLIGDIVGVSSFDVDGDQTANLIAGEIAFVKGSTGNDGKYTIASFVYNVGPDTTTITVVEPIPDLTPDGTIEFLRSYNWRPEMFDYAQPTAPVAPTVGDIWWQVDDPNMPVDDGLGDGQSVQDKQVFRWNGTVWVDITPLFRGFSFHGFDDLIFDALWDSEPYSVTHDLGNVTVNAIDDIFEIYGGNLIDHFINGTKMTGFKIVSGDPTPPGNLGIWRPDSFPILTVDDISNRFVIRGDQQALFAVGRILYVHFSDTNLGYFTITGVSYDGVSDTTTIAVSSSVSAAGRNLGIIAAATYDPTTFTTYLRTQQPVDTDVEAFTYQYIGPLRMTVDKQNVGADGDFLADLVFQDGLGISERLVSVPDRYEIQFTDMVADCFILEPIIDPTTGDFIDLSALFPVGARFRIVGSFDQINNYAQNPGVLPPYADILWTVDSHTFNPGTGENTVCVVEDITDDTLPYGAILYEPFIVGAQQERHVANTIVDELSFVWGQTKDFQIVATNQALSYVEIAGDVTGCILPWDEATIVGSDGNDLLPFSFAIDEAFATPDEFRLIGDATENLFSGIKFTVTGNGANDGQYTVAAPPVYSPGGPNPNTTLVQVVEDVTADVSGGSVAHTDTVYEVTGAVYLVGPNVTRVGLHSPNIPNQPDPGLDGVLRLENIDITNWFQYSLKSADSTTEEFIVNGDATGDIFVNAQFRVFGNGANNGIYTAAAAPVFDGICTTIQVIEDITDDVVGGVIESYRDNGIRIALRDEIGVEQIGEVAQGNPQIAGGGSFVGAWDYPFFDTGSWDDELNPLIHLYDNTF